MEDLEEKMPEVDQERDLMALLKTQSVAIVKVAPDVDPAVTALRDEAQAIRHYAEKRIITVNADLTSATEDLSLIAKLKKALESKKKEYTQPIKEQLDHVNNAFKIILAPIEEADRITRSKILTFRTEQERRRVEAERIEQEKLRLAREEAALNDGEITVDLSPVAKPDAVPDRVRTDLGDSGTMKVYKWELVDIALVPREYLAINAGMVSSVVKASKGQIVIPGIRIWTEDTIRVSTR